MTQAPYEQALVERIRALTAPLSPRPTGQRASLDPLPGIRAILLDVYGTLVISGCGDIGLTRDRAEPDQFLAAWRAAGLDTAVLPEDFDGRTALHAAIAASHARSRAAGIGHPEVDILAIWADVVESLGLAMEGTALRRLAVEYELRGNPVWPMPGLKDLIATLARRGIVLGIVSNAQFYTPLMLRAFLDRDLVACGFDPRCCAWSFEHGVAKPSVDIYQPALEGLATHHGLEPPQVLYVGNDRRNDIWPAARLGCRTALFAGDARSLRLRDDDPALGDLAADRVLTDLAQINALLPAAAGG